MINHINIEYIYERITFFQKLDVKISKTFVVTLLIKDVHIDVIHNIEQYDQLVEINHDMQLKHMLQKRLDFFHPIFNDFFISNQIKSILLTEQCSTAVFDVDSSKNELNF